VILYKSAADFMNCFHQVFTASVTYWVTLLRLQFLYKMTWLAAKMTPPGAGIGDAGGGRRELAALQNKPAADIFVEKLFP
jgi:hypothetical protein